jgi:hypothetical protein
LAAVRPLHLPGHSVSLVSADAQQCLDVLCHRRSPEGIPESPFTRNRIMVTGLPMDSRLSAARHATGITRCRGRRITRTGSTADVSPILLMPR